MSVPLDKLERLAKLRDPGAISQAEFESQKAAILAEPSSAARGVSTGRRRPVWLVALVGVASLLIVAWFVGSQDGKQDATAQVNQPADQATDPDFERVAADAANEASGLRPLPRGGEQPEADYLQRCIFAGFSPMGTRLRTFADVLAQKGRMIGWERSGESWVLRTQWHDPLTGEDHEEAYEFVATPDTQPARYCQGPLGEIELKRVARDGQERKQFDASLIEVMHRDVDPHSDLNVTPAQTPDQNRE